MDRGKNEEIRQRLNIPNTICEEVSKRRMKWFGHVVRMPHNRLPLQAYKNYFIQRRPPGRPPTRWRDQIQGDLGVPLQEASSVASFLVWGGGGGKTPKCTDKKNICTYIAQASA